MNIIECKNLTKEYISGDNTVKAVNNISVCFEKGEFCAVTGPSGSGKSTFIHMLSSLEYPPRARLYMTENHLANFQTINYPFFAAEDSALCFNPTILCRSLPDTKTFFCR